MKYINPEIVLTADGSHSLFVAELDESYHSHHGALQESMHVYIHAGLEYALNQGCKYPKVFELGMGTGLNAFLTGKYAVENRIKLVYHTIEKFPVNPEALHLLNYATIAGLKGHSELIDRVIDAEWDKTVSINEYFEIQKIYGDFLDLKMEMNAFDVFYFDAFGFRAQSELWSETVFQKCFDMLRPNGVLVTYAAKGLVRRTMQKIGFDVSRIPGAPGKREMLRAIKPADE